MQEQPEDEENSKIANDRGNIKRWGNLRFLGVK